jgi:Type I restriction modification DNA specificity domain
MAPPLLPNLAGWKSITLEANERLGYILAVDSGGTPSTSRDEFWDGDVPWLTPKEVSSAGETIYTSSTERNISKLGLDSSAAKLLRPDTVLLTKRAPVGEVAINAVPMATNQGFLNFTCGPRLRPLYLAYWLRANKRYLNQIANGSTYRELYKGDLFELVLFAPEVDEQDRILSVIRATQYVSLLGHALEQSAESSEQMNMLKDQDRRLRILRDSLVVHLLSGSIRVPKHGQPFKLTVQHAS